MSFRVISIHQQVHTMLRFVALLIGHCCSSSAFRKYFPFEASVSLGKIVYISQCLIELRFINLCKATKLIFIRGETHGVRLIKECYSLVVIVLVCDV